MKTNTNTNGLLYFTRSERSGIMFFALFCLLIFWLPSRFSNWKPSSKTDFSAFQQEIAVFKTRQPAPITQPESMVADTIDPNSATESQLIAIGLPVRTARTILKYREKGGQFRYREDLKKMYTIDEAMYTIISPYINLPSKSFEQKPKTVLVSNAAKEHLSPFDPNTAAKEDLLRLGIPGRVVNTLINYRSKGGTFRKKEDLQKVYGFTDDLYAKLAPYIQLEARAESHKNTYHTKKEPPESLDVNLADAAEWSSLPGIGPVLSSRIVKFRDKLGGFADVEQVAETYGLPDSTFQKIESLLIASPITPLLKINRCSVEELQAHPYLNWRQAKAMINYRIQHGHFKDLEDFSKIRALTEEQKEKLAPYLSFE